MTDFVLFSVAGDWSNVQDHRQNLPVADAHTGAAPHVGRHRHLGALHAHAFLQQLPGRGRPPALPLPRGDPAGRHRATVTSGFHPRLGDQHNPLPVHLLSAELQW